MLTKRNSVVFDFVGSLAVVLLLVLSLLLVRVQAEPIVLQGHEWQIRLTPETLRAEAVLASGETFLVSSGAEQASAVTELRVVPIQASWCLPAQNLIISVTVTGTTCRFDFKSTAPAELNWPRLVAGTETRALILPRYEGAYVPLDDAEWRAHLVNEGDAALAEALSMPFFGFDLRRRTITVLFATPFNNEFRFAERGKDLMMDLTHRFTRLDAAKEYAVVVKLGDGSPVEPARQYRRWLQEQGQFVSLAEKIRQVPRAERLLGALHGYLWGSDYLHLSDLRDWRGFASLLQAQISAATNSPGKHLVAQFSQEGKEALRQLLTQGGRYYQQIIAHELSTLIASTNLYERDAWAMVKLPVELADKLKGDISRLSLAERCALNAALLIAAFPEHLHNPSTWGDSISEKFLHQLHDAGIERACLTLNNLTPGNQRPEVARLADDLGYLYGPYDSYHSIHAPDERETWETAQFDAELYAQGAVVRANGQKWTGFQKKGYRLSALAARPYVERRVNELKQRVPFNSWFVDCDATGECYNNFSDIYPATQTQDFAARLERMQWLSRTHQLVVGSETGSGLAAAVIHFAHGMTTPVIGWGDPDLKERKSPYWLGAYYPPEAPSLFFKTVPLKPAYFKFHFDPRYRLPLYQVAFHDSVVTTHHWTAPSLKFSDQQTRVALTEQLYNVPPLYHFNLDEWKRNQARIKAHYTFFSPLHRELGLQPMIDFVWLSEDRLVQQTTFGDGTKIWVNFGKEAVQVAEGKIDLPPDTVLAQRSDGRVTRFSPSEVVLRKD